jgi:hypothetical protein
MAAEITASGSLELDDGTVTEMLAVSGLRFDWSGTKYTKHVQSIGTAEEAIDLGEISSVGWILAVNRDNTNFVSLRVGTGLTNAIRLDPKGGFALFRAGSGMTAPFAIADTAACRVEFFHIAAA